LGYYQQSTGHDISGGPERAFGRDLPTELGLVTRLQDFRVQNTSPEYFLATEVLDKLGVA
jgi:hypothetical protein